MRVAVCFVATALVFLPTNMTRIRLKKFAERRAGVKRSEKKKEIKTQGV